MSFEYFFILLLLFFLASYLKYLFKIKIFKNYKQVVVFYFAILVIGTIWDNFAVLRGHWFYPGHGITGIFVGLVPIEDYFFGVICAYFVLVLYQVVKKRIR